MRTVGFRIHGDGGDLVRDLLGEQHVLLQVHHFLLAEFVFGFLQIALAETCRMSNLATAGDVIFDLSNVTAGAAGEAFEPASA